MGAFCLKKLKARSDEARNVKVAWDEETGAAVLLIRSHCIVGSSFGQGQGMFVFALLDFTYCLLPMDMFVTNE